MKITAEVSGPPQYGQASPYYIDNDEESTFYRDVYVLVQDAAGSQYCAMSMTRTMSDGTIGISRAGWSNSVEGAITGGLTRLTPILPPRKITIEIKP